MTAPDTSLLTRRRLFGTAGTGLAAAGLVACGGPGSSTPPTATGNGEVSGEFSFYHWRTEDRAAIESLGQAFVERHRDVEYSQIIDPSDQYEATGAQKARSGTVGDSLTAFRGPQFLQFAELGIFADLSDVDYLGHYDPELITHGASEGKQLGFPYQLLFNMPLLNTDLAEQAGLSELPQNWDEYLDSLDKLKGLGVHPIAWPGNDFQIVNSLAMNAPEDGALGQIETGERKVTDAWFLDLLEKWKLITGYFQPNFSGTKLDGALALFTQGKAAMLPTGSFHIVQVRDAGAEFGIELAPVITTERGETPRNQGIYNATFILGVNARASNPDAAHAWVEFLSEPEQAAAYADATSQHVTVTGVEYSNPDLKALEGWIERPLLLAPRFQFTSVDVRSAVENSLVAVASGTSVNQAAEAAQKIVDEKRPQ